MSKNQKIAFWALYIGFCIAGTGSIYYQGAFELTDTTGGLLILVAFYLVVAAVIYLFIKKNPELVENTFRK